MINVSSQTACWLNNSRALFMACSNDTKVYTLVVDASLHREWRPVDDVEIREDYMTIGPEE
jgi:hypothetical protein